MAVAAAAVSLFCPLDVQVIHKQDVDGEWLNLTKKPYIAHTLDIKSFESLSFGPFVFCPVNGQIENHF